MKAIVAAALFALACAAAQAQAPSNPSRLYEDALARFEKKDFPGAIIQLKNALKVDNKNLSVQVLLGRALLANGEVVAAEVALGEALRLGVSRAEVVMPLARALVDQGKQQELLSDPRLAPGGLPPAMQMQMLLMRAGAAADLADSRAALRFIEEARTIDPNIADSWLAEVPIRIRARQPREALAAADKALTMTPRDAEAIYVRGTVSHVLGDTKGALSWYDKTLAQQPTHTEALVSRAGMYFDLGRLDDAERDVTELMRVSRTEPRGAYLKALIAERRGNAAAARSALNEVTALLDPAPPAFLRYRPQLLMLGGLSHYGLKQFEKAKPYLEMIQRLQPNSPVNKLLANIHLKDNNLDRAIESLDNYLRAFPGDGQAVLLLASAHMAQGRYARATQLTQDALKLGDAAGLRTMLGLSLVGSGKLNNAVPELEAAVKKDPGQIQAGSALVTLYLKSGQAARAVRMAELLLKQQPGNAGLHNLLGLSRVAAADAEGGRAAFEQALKIDAAYAAPQIQLARLDAQRAPDAAIARLQAVLAREEKNIEALLALGALAEQRRQLTDAQRWLEKADDLAGPNVVQAGLALVDFHLRHRQLELAREATKRLTTKAPESMDVLLMLARASLAGGDTAGARTTLSRAASLANYDAPLLLNIALMQLQAGHVPGAAHSLDKALSERPDLLAAQAVMADVEVRQGELGKAEARARQLVAKNPKLGVGHGLLGDVALARNQVPAAVEHYRRAYQAEPTSDSLLRLFRVMSSTDAAAANNLVDQWLKQRPKDLLARRALADGFARIGNLSAARQQYETLVKVAPDDAEALNNLANVLLMSKDPGALAMAERAMAKNPGAPHIIGTAGWAAFQAGQSDRALQLLRDARLRDPNNPDTRYFLGAVLASAGRQAEARAELEGALKGGRKFASAADAEQLLRTLK